jgi:TolB-like protein
MLQQLCLNSEATIGNKFLSLFNELKRRNVFKVSIAYIVMAWLVMQVADVILNNVDAPGWVFHVILLLLGIGLPFAVFFAWAFELTPDGLKREHEVDRSQSKSSQTGRKLDYAIIGVLIVALAYFAYDKFVLDPSRDSKLVQAITEAAAEQVTGSNKADAAEKSIAVLPFVNMSDDPGNEYFSDGIAEELMNVLVKVAGLRVASRTSSFSFKGKDTSIPGIAKALNVDHVLEGSVRKAGNTIRVPAQLIDVRTDSHLWSGTYDRELADIFAIQDEISGQIVQALKVALRTGEQEAMAHAQKPTDNLEAYELYLRGRFAWQLRGEDNIRHAIDLFEQATELDPQFARAWSSLAAARMTLPSYSDAPGEEYFPLAVSAAQKALELDDSLAEALAVLADMARVDRKWAEAEAYYLRAIASEPKNTTARLWYSEHLVMVGRLRNALEEILIAYQLDPLAPVTNKATAAIYLFSNDSHNALKYGAAAWDLGHSVGLYVLVMANLHLGKFDQAIKFAKQFDDLWIFPVSITTLFVEAEMDPAKKPLLLEMLAKHETEVGWGFLLQGYTGNGRVDDAYRLVNMNSKPERFSFTWVIWRPDMAPFRQDPRFAELATELGLLDYWRENGWPDACQPAGDSVICE